PPIPRDKKWVIIVSTSFGCPVKCLMCDASIIYKGNLKTQEMIEQIDYLVTKYFPDRKVPIPKFKIQFARMGEPAFNNNVLEVLGSLPELYKAPGLMPAISTLAPKGRDKFFNELIKIKDRYYSNGRFQLQFSIHTTNTDSRDRLMPVKKWNFKDIADYGEKFFNSNDRKITLNFACTQDYEVEPEVIREYFNPEFFTIKLTPLNPTVKAYENKLVSFINPYQPESASQLINEFKAQGFEVVLSIGEVEENKIGSNCGLYLNFNRKNSSAC
ncbi:MAG: radical SAM protein, partial [Candidatus Thermoplasmatota archaeon]